MAMKLYDSSSIQSIADAIRAKDGDATLMKVTDMPDRIGDLPSLNNYFSFLGPDAESIALFSDSYTLKQLGYDSWTPSTSSISLAASTKVNSQSYQIDFNEYNFALVQEWDFVPVYSTGSTAQSRIDRQCSFHITGYRRVPNISSLDTSTITWGSYQTYSQVGGLCVYYSSSGVRTMSGSNISYGVYMGGYPTASGSINATTQIFNVTSISRGQISARCNTNYFSTGNAALIDVDNSTLTYELNLVKFKKPNFASYFTEGMLNIYKNPL